LFGRSWWCSQSQPEHARHRAAFRSREAQLAQLLPQAVHDLAVWKLTAPLADLRRAASSQDLHLQQDAPPERRVTQHAFGVACLKLQLRWREGSAKGRGVHTAW